MADDGHRDRTIERQIFLRSLNVARPLGSASRQLARAMRDEFIPAGETLFRRGDHAREIYFVVKGEVEMSLEGAEPWKLHPPSIVGILDVLQDRVRERTATALTDVQGLVLSAEDYFDVLEDNFEYARAGVEGVAANLHSLSLELAPTGGFPAPPTAIPPPARPLDLVERTLVLHAAPAFHAARVQSVTRLAGLAEEFRFNPGDVISRRGDPCDALLVVACGLVQVSREGPRMQALFGAGSIVSGYATLGHNTHEYDEVVVAPTTALRVRKADFFDLLEDHFEVTRSILAFLGGERERIYAESAARIKVEKHIPIWSLAKPDAARDIEAISRRLTRP